MISLLPAPLPDEAIYSIISRYNEALGYTGESDAWEDFCLDKRSRPRVFDTADLPGLAEAIPEAWLPRIDLIRDHSLHHFLRAFSDSIYINSHSKVHNSYNKNGFVRGSQYFCTCCVQEDITAYGTPYWHRLHQVHGVFVCYQHNCFLNKIEILPGQLLLPPPDAGESAYLSQSDPAHRLLIQLSIDSEKLIAAAFHDGRQRLYNALNLSRKSLRFNSKRLGCVATLEKLLFATYSEELRTAFFFPKPRRKISWTARVSTQAVSFTPLIALLSLYALGLTADALLNAGEQTVIYDEYDISRAHQGIPIITKALNMDVFSPIEIAPEVAEFIRSGRDIGIKRGRSRITTQTHIDLLHGRFDTAISLLRESRQRICKSTVARTMHLSDAQFVSLIREITSLREKFEAVQQTYLEFNKARILNDVLLRMERGLDCSWQQLVRERVVNDKSRKNLEPYLLTIIATCQNKKSQ